MNNDLTVHSYKISREDRRRMNGHNSFLVFFTGLSGSGKSTLCNALEQLLHQKGIRTYVLDGDNIRLGINKNLGFSPEDRTENIRRIGEISNLFIEAGIVILAAFVAPYQRDRENIRSLVGADHFVEVFVNTPLEICEARDVKGLYAKARKGEITNMTGISAPYEAPDSPDIEIDGENSIETGVNEIFKSIEHKLELKA
ncbi:MAG: adenylyl-sulfate kinase [Robiginitalea sp.]|uniref:adenylyl-sulfate kinase n=1 Tax=Robiginitalea sp. TaxID=1902411 RepID=UPI003C70C3B0